MSGVTAPSSSLDRFTGRDLVIIFSSFDPFVEDELQQAEVPRQNKVKKMPPTKLVEQRAKMTTPEWNMVGGLGETEAASLLPVGESMTAPGVEVGESH